MSNPHNLPTPLPSDRLHLEYRVYRPLICSYAIGTLCLTADSGRFATLRVFVLTLATLTLRQVIYGAEKFISRWAVLS